MSAVSYVLECHMCWGKEWCFCDFLCAVMWGTFPAEHLPNTTEFLKCTAVFFPGAVKVRKHSRVASTVLSRCCKKLFGIKKFAKYQVLPSILYNSNIQGSLGCAVRRRGRVSPWTLLSLGLFYFSNSPWNKCFFGCILQDYIAFHYTWWLHLDTKLYNPGISGGSQQHLFYSFFHYFSHLIILNYLFRTVLWLLFSLLKISRSICLMVFYCRKRKYQ